MFLGLPEVFNLKLSAKYIAWSFVSPGFSFLALKLYALCSLLTMVLANKHSLAFPPATDSYRVNIEKTIRRSTMCSAAAS